MSVLVSSISLNLFESEASNSNSRAETSPFKPTRPHLNRFASALVKIIERALSNLGKLDAAAFASEENRGATQFNAFI